MLPVLRFQGLARNYLNAFAIMVLLVWSILSVGVFSPLFRTFCEAVASQRQISSMPGHVRSLLCAKFVVYGHSTIGRHPDYGRLAYYNDVMVRASCARQLRTVSQRHCDKKLDSLLFNFQTSHLYQQ